MNAHESGKAAIVEATSLHEYRPSWLTNGRDYARDRKVSGFRACDIVTGETES